MSKTPAFWIEARCGSVTGAGGSNWILPGKCHQTANDGGFFSGIRKARKHHEAQGWKVIDGEWWCPVCVKILQS